MKNKKIIIKLTKNQWNKLNNIFDSFEAALFYNPSSGYKNCLAIIRSIEKQGYKQINGGQNEK